MSRRLLGRSVPSSACALILALVAGVPMAGHAAFPVVSLTLSPATIAGGTGGEAIGTVTISAPAAPGGQVINLTSSNTDLAASTPRVVIPEGATIATFTVGTNAFYRAYSGLAFNVIITATNRDDGSSASATLQVTAQAIPGPFTGGTVSTDGNATAGNMCGGSFGTNQAKERGILYRCEFPQAGQFSVCRFLQECSFGCETRSAPLLDRRDVCTAGPPFPIAVAPEIVEGGRRSNGTVFLSAPAPSLANANVNVSPIGTISPGGGFPVPEGATSASFDVDTYEVAVPAFLGVRLILSNPQERYAQDYLAVVPAAGSVPPSEPLRVFSVDTNPMAVVQGNPSIGTVILNGVARSGGAAVSLSTNNPAASVPSTVTVPAGQTATTFGVTTGSVSSPTPVTITATFGGVSRSTRLTVSPFIFPTTTPALSALSVSPSAVVAGTRSIGRVTLTAPAPDPSNGVVSIALATDNPAVVVVQRNVTVGYGGTIQDFRISTFAAAEPTPVTITASYNGVTRSATLTVNPSGPAPPPALGLSSVSVNPTAVVGGNSSTGTVTLTGAAPGGGASVSLTRDNPAVTGPASVAVPAGQTSASFEVTTSAVTMSTPVTITGTFASTSRSATLTVNPAPAPATLSALSLNPTSVVGGNASTGTVTLSAAAPGGGAVVSLSDNSSAATSVPANVTVPAGATSASFTVTTSSVTASTSATISAVFAGVTRTATLTVNPSTPSAPSLAAPANGATVAQPVTLDWNNVTNATSYDVQVDNSSTISAPFIANPTVTPSQTTLSGLPAQQLWWRVRARNAAGVFGPFSSTRRFTPQGAPTAASLSAVSVNPTSVVGGVSSTGTVTLTAAAPTGGAVVTLSDNSAAATVPPSVTVAAGATSATFTVTTGTVTASAPVTITGSFGGATRTATLTVNPPGQAATLTVTATGRSGERVTSNPAGINVSVGSSGSASFTSGTSITLRVTDGRDAIWSGACSSGGSKTETCTFTITGNAAVTGNVQ